jgi:energy-coupling factor transporter ATP-binding protein EcfA2
MATEAERPQSLPAQIAPIAAILDKHPFPRYVLGAGAVAATICLLFWPIFVFHRDPGLVGFGFWLVILATATAVAIAAFLSSRDDQKDRIAKQPQAAETVVLEYDRAVFKDKIRTCFKDPRIVGYFSRKIVEEDVIASSIMEGSAFEHAIEIFSYLNYANSRDELANMREAESAINSNARSNIRVAISVFGLVLLVALVFTEIAGVPALTSGLAFVPLLLESLFMCILARAIIESRHRLLKVVATIASLGALASSVFLIPILTSVRWPIILLPITFVVLLVAYFLADGRTSEQILSLIIAGWIHLKIYLRFELWKEDSQGRAKWLEDCVEDIIMPEAVWAINTALGTDKDRLLVEQDSEGLRRLQDPSFTVSTQSEHQIASLLSQMDGGSIAIAGPRGVGKSTLLRKFSGLQRKEKDKESCISVYLTAPAEYIPKDFIATLFQRLAEEYLVYANCPLPGEISKERLPFRLRDTFGNLFKALWLILRFALAAALVVWIWRSFVHIHYRDFYLGLRQAFEHLHKKGYDEYLSFKRATSAWVMTALKIMVVSYIALKVLPDPSGWERHIKRRREPPLAKKAREYLVRLQTDKTITWGSGINSPMLRGVSVSFNRGGTASYVPWTLPELVGHMRSFIQDISVEFKESAHPVVVGIDEIDRIGSVEHAEKFIGEIKAIFGVERCFFLVAVAEDVGSIFAQRATAGRSILENAFDDVIAVEPLNFVEARGLLLKRVPGFTDSFVYLAHAMSGGLPRELIRVTRRLVDLNRELSTENHPARLENLAFAIAKEELIEAIRATRTQMSRLMLHAQWTDFFEKLRAASIRLRFASPFSVNESYNYIKELSELAPPNAPGGVTTNEEEAKRIVRDFSTFSYFVMTIIDAFSDTYFDLESVQDATTNGASEGSYEELAIARTELAVSSENGRAMISRFRTTMVSKVSRPSANTPGSGPRAPRNGSALAAP